MSTSLPDNTKKHPPLSSRGINLVPQDLKETPRNRTIKKVLSRTSFLLIGLYTFALIGLFAFSFVLNTQAKKLETTNTALVSDVTKMQAKEELLHTIKNRTGLARKIFANTSPQAAENFDKVVELVPGDMSIVGTETKDNAVLLSARSANPASLQNFLTSLENAKLKDVAVQTITSAFGGYTITIHVQ